MNSSPLPNANGPADVPDSACPRVADNVNVDINRLTEAICQNLAEIARVIRRQRGTADRALNGESDLAQSVAAEIQADPIGRLSGVYTVEELRGRLYSLLFQKWVEHQRRALAEKRGSGRVQQASQLGNPDDSSPLHVAERGYGNLDRPTSASVQIDVAMMLSTFAPESERRKILSWLLEGWTQEQIGEQLGLSRDAVGRRVRSLYQALQQTFGENDLASKAGES